jgi:hypothetical protein
MALQRDQAFAREQQANNEVVRLRARIETAAQSSRAAAEADVAHVYERARRKEDKLIEEAKTMELVPLPLQLLMLFAAAASTTATRGSQNHGTGTTTTAAADAVC